jgi:hypothetical protein
MNKKIEEKYVEIMRRKSGEERVKIALELRNLVLRLAKDNIKDQNPRLSSKKIKRILQKRIYGFSFPFKGGDK